MTTPHDDFYLDVRWCGACGTYVPYLSSPGSAWCVWCGEEVRLLSAADMAAFRADVKRSRRSAWLGHQDEVA